VSADSGPVSLDIQPLDAKDANQFGQRLTLRLALSLLVVTDPLIVYSSFLREPFKRQPSRIGTRCELPMRYRIWWTR